MTPFSVLSSQGISLYNVLGPKLKCTGNCLRFCGLLISGPRLQKFSVSIPNVIDNFYKSSPRKEICGKILSRPLQKLMFT